MVNSALRVRHTPPPVNGRRARAVDSGAPVGDHDSGMDTPTEKFPVGISSCLLGELVRYDGGHRHARFICDELGDVVRWVPTCPEIGAGMAVPRESIRLVRTADGIRLLGNHSNNDVTDAVTAYSDRRIEELVPMRLRGHIFKKGSPSCGIGRVRLIDESGADTLDGVGLFAARFKRRFPDLPVEDEERLEDPLVRENFIEQLFACDRRLRLAEGRSAPDQASD